MIRRPNSPPYKVCSYLCYLYEHTKKDRHQWPKDVIGIFNKLGIKKIPRNNDGKGYIHWRDTSGEEQFMSYKY